ncbi:MAG TPA: RsfA family transcriptional regulator [Bacillales bacterium]|nr:RsfA family transcriptional regulator [Bacillales bacterium]
MTASRQDAWNREEDLVLAEVVLRHIREGSTQLAAFEEVGERLSRTSAACGFRWNSLVRKKYQSAITLAKKQRKQLKQPAPTSSPENRETDQEEALSLDDVIAYLEKFRSTAESYEHFVQQNESLKTQVSLLEEEKARLEQTVVDVKKENRSIQDDYRALIEIMDRARKRAVLHGGNGEADSLEHERVQEINE